MTSQAAILVLAEKQTKAQNDRQFYRNSRTRTEKELEATTNLITESEAELEVSYSLIGSRPNS